MTLLVSRIYIFISYADSIFNVADELEQLREVENVKKRILSIYAMKRKMEPEMNIWNFVKEHSEERLSMSLNGN